MSGLPLTRPSLLLAVRDSQNDQAWREFVELYMPLIFGHCRRRGLQEADSADVAQEVMKAVVGAMGQFEYRPERGSFRSWLLTVVRNKLNTFFTRQARLPELPGDTQLPDPTETAVPVEEDAVWEKEYRQRLFDWAVGRVRTEFRSNTWLSFWKTAVEKSPVPEVASELQLSPGAVYIARSRVIARLRQEIESAGGEGYPLTQFGEVQAGQTVPALRPA